MSLREGEPLRNGEVVKALTEALRRSSEDDQSAVRAKSTPEEKAVIRILTDSLRQQEEQPQIPLSEVYLPSEMQTLLDILGSPEDKSEK